MSVLNRVYRRCPSVAGLIKPFVYRGLPAGWTATVSETVSKAESHGTIHHYLSELAETLPLLAFTHAAIGLDIHDSLTTLLKWLQTQHHSGVSQSGAYVWPFF
jgi:hypothetical protein